MRREFWGFAFVIALCAPAAAQAPGLEQKWTQCTNTEWAQADDLSIGACTAS